MARLSPLGVLVTRCEVVLGGLFLFAAYNKLWHANDPQLFSASVQAFIHNPDFPPVLVRLATGVTPWVEVVAGVLLILGLWSRAAAAVLAGLLVLFIGLIAQAMLRGLELDCGCFGKLSPFCPPKVSACNVYQNVILLAMALVIALTPRHRLVRAPAGA
jgi:uncharacterized membrane protein YphA (DoxX/SURF4 family)